MAQCAESPAYGKLKFKLNTGTEMPAIGLGTFRIRQESVIMDVVDWALKAGYRSFDTAAVYGNEGYLQKAFKASLPKYGLERKDIFVTTKLSPSDYGSSEIIEKAYKKSLDNLGLDYVDLYLIHFPGGARVPARDELNVTMRDNAWRTLAQIYKDGRAKAVGVSNFTTRHLRELLQNNHGVVPAVNQVEWHPYYFQTDLYNLCKENNILLQAYCSLGGTSCADVELLDNPVVQKIAKSLGVTRPQLLLVWALQQGVAVIPKSVNRSRIEENFSLNFKIPEEDIKALNSLGKQNIKYAWDPNCVK